MLINEDDADGFDEDDDMTTTMVLTMVMIMLMMIMNYNENYDDDCDVDDKYPWVSSSHIQQSYPYVLTIMRSAICWLSVWLQQSV